MTDTPPGFAGAFNLSFGADHGSGANFSSCAVLVGTVKNDDGSDSVWVLDEYVSDGMTTEVQDAKGVVEMLARWGWKWSDVHAAYGDRVHYGAGGRRGNQLGKKSNGQMQRAIARELGVQPHEMGVKIRTVKKGAGSVHLGYRWLHRAMVRGDFRVSQRCTRVLGMLNNFDGSDNEWKHIADCIRYALNAAIFAPRKRVATSIRNG